MHSSQNSGHLNQESHHNQQQQHKQPMPKSKQDKSHPQSNSQVASMIQDFSKAVQEIPKKEQQPKPSKANSDKSSGLQASGSESSSAKAPADKKSPSKDINKKYHEAVEKAYQSYAKLYEHIQKNHMSISQSQFDEVKKGAKKLFTSRNVQNKAWTKKTIHISNEPHNSSNQNNKK